MAAASTQVLKRVYFELFGISFMVLFLELTCIRWFGSHVVFLTFFTNIVLLASFLGMSVGCLAASRKITFINWLPLILFVAVCTAILTLLLYGTVAEFAVAVGDQNSPERVYFGTEYRHPDVSKVIIPMEAIAGFFFVLIALAFVGLGQVMGRYFDMIPKRLQAYTTNIVGSLVGIIAFAIISYLWLSPFWWFLIGLGCSCYFLDGTLKRRILNISIAVVTICLIGFLGWGIGLDKIGNFISPDLGKRLASEEVLWSPYYRVVHNTVTHDIAVNNIGHQTMISVGEKGPAYSLPYLLNRDSGRPFIDDVLIIGAGSGNDVSAALMAGVKHIDAVEIDPVIMHLGEKHHPNNPYANERVKLHSNDGRNSLKTSDRKYDLVIYALVDSLVLHSGYSNIRLESFLFTKEAFEDIKARLKVNGIFVMYNFYRQGWIVGRLRNLAKDVFEKEPIVISIPYLSEINDSIMKGGGYTMILVGDTEKISNAFESNGSYWIPKSDYMTQSAKTGFATFPPADDVQKLGPAKVYQSAASKVLPSDNWPFLYLNKRTLSKLTIRGMIVIAVLSILLLLLFAPRKTIRFNWTMFFLGAGFMLLETKGVVHLALLFGSTWIVNSIVFFAILVMILLSNLFVLKFNPSRLIFYYVALILLLILNIFIGLEIFLGMPELVKLVGSCLMVFTPVFFAGVLFASYFRDSTNPDMDFGSNIAGIVLGGLAENLSMILGFNHLLWVAIVFYILSKLLKGKLYPKPV